MIDPLKETELPNRISPSMHKGTIVPFIALHPQLSCYSHTLVLSYIIFRLKIISEILAVNIFVAYFLWLDRAMISPAAICTDYNELCI